MNHTRRRVWGAVTALVALGVAAPLASVVSGSREHGHSRAAMLSDAGWSRSVTRICAGALLFEGRHESGTYAGAVAVSRDIRSSTEGRLQRVTHLVAPARHTDIRRRWIALERRLAAAYALSYVRIYDVIAATRTRGQHAQEPRRLGQLLHAPDKLSMAAARLEHQLSVPDCTGGTPVAPPEARISA